MRTILIVCTGNLCRSPMAALLLQARLAADPARSGWRVCSAGLWTAEDLPASPHAVTMMQEQGLDLTAHRSRRVSEQMVEQADLILAATPNHVEALRLAFPQSADRIHLLAAMAGESHGVEDPYGRPLANYQAVTAELTRLIEAGYARLVALAERKHDPAL
jgi:protein-tyrosine-phosphatase